MRKVRTKSEVERLRKAILRVVGKMKADAEGWIHGVSLEVRNQLGDRFKLTAFQISHHLKGLVTEGRLEQRVPGSSLYRISRGRKPSHQPKSHRSNPGRKSRLRVAIERSIAVKESELAALTSLLKLAEENEPELRRLLREMVA